jgi:hypothetical protein
MSNPGPFSLQREVPGGFGSVGPLCIRRDSRQEEQRAHFAVRSFAAFAYKKLQLIPWENREVVRCRCNDSTDLYWAQYFELEFWNSSGSFSAPREIAARQSD